MRSAGRQNTDKNKNKYPPLLRRQGLFLPPHLRLQTEAYLPQEGGALIFKQGAKRRAKRFCPSSGLSPRAKKRKGTSRASSIPTVNSFGARLSTYADRRTSKFRKSPHPPLLAYPRPYEQRSARRCQNLRVCRTLLPLFVSTYAIRLVILRVFPVDGKGRRW